MSPIPESAHSSSHWAVYVLLNLMGHIEGFADHKGSHLPLLLNGLFLGPGTLKWASPASGCFAFYLRPATLSVFKASVQTFTLSLPLAFPPGLIPS